MTERVDPSTWPLYPPESWFDLPGEVPDDVYCNVVLDGPEAGRVYGLVHHAGTNLLGASEVWSPPPSPSALHDSQLGVTETAEGTTVRTANVGGRVNHAPLTSGYHEAVKHYENIASQTMRVRYHQVQTASGPAIAYSGAMWPDVTEIDVARVRASALSGDWRWRDEYGGYDFCGSQLVTNPGLPLRMVASLGDDHPPIVQCDDGTCSLPPAVVASSRIDDIENAVLEFADLLGYTVEPAPHTAAICAPADRLDDIEDALSELVIAAAMTAGGEYIKSEHGYFAGSLPGAKANRDIENLLAETGLVKPDGENVFTHQPFTPYQDPSTAKREACQELADRMNLDEHTLGFSAFDTFGEARLADARMGAVGSFNASSSSMTEIVDENITVAEFGELTDLEHQMYDEKFNDARAAMQADLDNRAVPTDTWGDRNEFTAAEYLDLAREHGFDPEAERGIASRYVDQWATSAGDSAPLSVAIQEVAEEKWGGDASHLREYTDAYGSEVASIVDREGGIIEDYLGAMRAGTQERVGNITNPDGNVLLYRGVTYDAPLPDTDHVATNPLSSWTTDRSVAESFGGGGGPSYGYVLSATVPVSSIVSTPATGAGCLQEHEIIVLAAGDISVTMTPNTDEARAYHAKAAAVGDPGVLFIDDDRNADWPKRTPDTFDALRAEPRTAGQYTKGEGGLFTGSEGGAQARLDELPPATGEHGAGFDKDITGLFGTTRQEAEDAYYRLEMVEREGEGTPEKVAIADLLPAQFAVRSDAVAHDLKDPTQEPITVVKDGDQMVIMDGNHRATAAALRGDATIDARVWTKADEFTAKTAGAWTKGEGGLFTGSEPGGGRPEKAANPKREGASVEELMKDPKTREAVDHALNDVKPKIDDYLAANGDTKTQNSVDGEYTAERLREQDEAIDELWDRNGFDDVPTDQMAVFTGGLPGAGKSTMLDDPESGIDKADYITLNPDDMKEIMIDRGMGPSIDGVKPMETSGILHEESSDMALRLADRAMAQGKNVIWDVTMGSQGSVEKRLDKLDANGYTTKLTFIDVPQELSQAAVLGRYARSADSEMGGRFVDPAFIAGSSDPTGTYDSSNRVAFEALKDRVDDWQLWDGTTDPPTQLATKGGT